MVPRHLGADEAALWRRVIASVRPLRPHAAPIAEPPPGPPPAGPSPAAPPTRRPPPKATAIGHTLDGGWDRRLASGAAAPDSTIDLHGHSLDRAYLALDLALERAIARGDRVLLLITGKPPRPESERPHARGRIRAAVGDWLMVSRHAGHIAAVRAAHPRHGGAGALYIVLRRARDTPKS